MGRWRPAERPGSQYITPAGEARLRAELDALWRVERPQVTQSVSEAAAQGDEFYNPADSEIVDTIKDLIETRLRHALA